MTKASTEPRNWWPIGIAITLAIVVMVNVAFIVIAVRGSDPVVPSYSAEAR
ncbi:MAG: hypothetical protein ACJ8AU_10125 [Gemmatimonadales bacterium]